MKKFRKLIPALCMLLISAVLLGTSTFAWFSMNTTVTATGMQVTAKTDHTYLLISTTNSKIANPSEDNKTVEFSGTTNLAPSAHKTFTTGADAATAGNWFTAVSDNPQTGVISGTGTDLEDSNFRQYVLKQTVYISITEGSVAAKDLKVKATIADSNDSDSKTDITPIRVLVVCGENYVELDSTKTDFASTVLKDAISDTDIVAVDIYIYYDGTDDGVTTNNSANLAGAKVDLTFSVDQ